MKKVLVSLMVFVCTIAAFAAPGKSTARATQQGTASTSVNFNGKKYYLQYSAGNSQQWLNEYLPAGATFNNYTEMIAVRSYDGIEATPEQIGTSIVSNLLNNYPDTPYNLVKGAHPGEVEVSFGIATASVDEFNLFRIVPGKNGHPIALQYVRRALLPSPDDPKWKEITDKFVYALQHDFDQWLQAIQTMPVPAINRTLKQ